MTANQAEPVRGATDSRPRWRTPKYLAALLVVGAPVMVRAVCDATLPEQKTPNSSGRRLDVRPGVPFPGCVYGQGNVASTPYPSITAAANCAGAGDTIYVHQGTYYGQQSIVGRSGTASAWIVVTSAPGEIGPKLRGTGINNRGVGVLQVENSSYIAIGPGFDVGVADARGINVVASSAAVHHVIVFGNSVHDNTDAGIFFGTLPGQTISDVGAFRNSLQNNATINAPLGPNNLTCPAGLWSGLSSWPASISTGQFLGQSCVHVKGNTVTNSYGECIDLQGVDTGWVVANTVHGCFNTALYLDGSRSVVLDGNYVYEPNNCFYRSFLGGAVAPVGVLMAAETAPVPFPHTDHVIRNNILDGVRGITYNVFSGFTNSYYGRLTVAHNTIVRPAGPAINIALPPASQSPVSPNYLDNNVAYGGSSALALQGAQYWLVHNNDFPGAPAGLPLNAGASNYTFDPGLGAPSFGIGVDPVPWSLSG